MSCVGQGNIEWQCVVLNMPVNHPHTSKSFSCRKSRQQCPIPTQQVLHQYLKSSTPQARLAQQSLKPYWVNLAFISTQHYPCGTGGQAPYHQPPPIAMILPREAEGLQDVPSRRGAGPRLHSTRHSQRQLTGPTAAEIPACGRSL